MITPMIVTFRECFEILLVIVPLIAYLYKTGKGNLVKNMYIGIVLGIITSAVGGVFLFGKASALTGSAQELFKGGTMVFIAGLIIYSMVLMKKQYDNFSSKTQNEPNVKMTAVSLFLLAFLTVFRECLEIVLFILPMFNDSSLMITEGILLGALLSLCLTFVLYKTTVKLNISVIFSILNLMFILIGASMFGEGLALIIPSAASIETAGKMVYAIPLLYLLLKNEAKRYIKKINKN